MWSHATITIPPYSYSFGETIVMRWPVVDFGREDLRDIRLLCAPGSTYIFVKVSRSWHRVFLSEIIYIECCKNHAKVHTTSKHYPVLSTMKSIEYELPRDHFFRVNASVIVNIPYINLFNPYELIISNGMVFSFGKDGYVKLRKKIIRLGGDGRRR